MFYSNYSAEAMEAEQFDTAQTTCRDHDFCGAFNMQPGFVNPSFAS